MYFLKSLLHLSNPIGSCDLLPPGTDRVELVFIQVAIRGEFDILPEVRAMRRFPGGAEVGKERLQAWG